MDRCVILVDNSNLFIAGRQLAAKRNGANGKRNGKEEKSRAPEKGSRGGEGPPRDAKWRLDFDALYRCLAADREVHAAIMVGSAPSDEEAGWDVAARAAGFQTIVQRREPGLGEKEVDTELVARGAELIAGTDAVMVLVLGSGDRDYVPLVELAKRHGWDVELRAFKSSYDNGGELAGKSDRVLPLDECFDELTLSPE